MGKGLRRAAWTVAALAGAVGVLFGAAWFYSEQAMQTRYVLSDPPLRGTGDAAEAARGAHLYQVLGCVDCHAAGGVGKEVFDAGPVARVVAPNLTPTALAGRYDADQLAAAIRHGVGPDGRPLRFMPSADYHELSDADTAALVRHLQSLPDSGNDPGAFELRPLGRVLFMLGQFELLPARHLDHAPRVRTSPAPGPTAEYGGYLAQTCTGCHGKDHGGQHVPGTPADFPDAANLTPHANGLAGWTEADFVRVIREGRRPDGRELHPLMPWRTYAAMTDDELRAIWRYLSALPPRERKAAKG
ncbi:c-type cytochrome [Arenimonas sp. MALMAid1274]|uniref:c-type cytochrome n=1 Tax=Arenimonas sp. MALMAid1274 TaxID=3411630 RepID=UPI003BA0CD1F